MDPFCYLCFKSVMLSCLFFAALLYVMFSRGFVTLPYGVLGQVWYLIVLIPDLCPLPYFMYYMLLCESKNKT